MPQPTPKTHWTPGASGWDLRDPEARIPQESHPAIHQAVLAASRRAGLAVKDGLLEDPRSVRFDPKVLACTGADTASRLTPTAGEVGNDGAAGAGAQPHGRRDLSGYMPGSELMWDV